MATQTQDPNPERPKRAKSKPLSIKRQKFVEALVGPAAGNKTKAAEMAGYAMPESQGSRLSKFVEVAEAVEKRLSRVTRAMETDEILYGLSQIARGKRPSKVTVEEGFVASKDGQETIPVQKTKTEYDRMAGYEGMAKVRGLMQPKDRPNEAAGLLTALASVPAPALLELAKALLAADEMSRAIPVESRTV